MNIWLYDIISNLTLVTVDLDALWDLTWTKAPSLGLNVMTLDCCSAAGERMHTWDDWKVLL